MTKTIDIKAIIAISAALLVTLLVWYSIIEIKSASISAPHVQEWQSDTSWTKWK